MTSGQRRPPNAGAGFTLVELLVVIAIMAILIGALAPALRAARAQARLVTCAASQRQLLLGVAAFASDHNGLLPLGPTTMSPFGVAWSEFPGGLLWTGAMSNDLTGVGVLMGGYIDEKGAYFCAGDDTLNVDQQLANIGTPNTAVGSYAYRSLSEMSGRRLWQMGCNSAGLPAGALLLDAQLVGPPGAGLDHVTHEGEALSVGFNDGHVLTRPNRDPALTFFVDSQADLFARIVSEPRRLFILADSLQ